MTQGTNTSKTDLLIRSYHIERRNRSIDDIQLDPRDEKSQTMKFEKKFYNEHEKTKQLTEKEVNDFRLKHDIKVFGKNVPKPVISFEATNFPKYILDVIKKDGFKAPTPIQAQAWPIVLSGNDIIGLAETGYVYCFSTLFLSSV
jgi:superfamily II DNA/RNA helicase